LHICRNISEIQRNAETFLTRKKLDRANDARGWVADWTANSALVTGTWLLGRGPVGPKCQPEEKNKKGGLWPCQGSNPGLTRSETTAAAVVICGSCLEDTRASFEPIQRADLVLNRSRQRTKSRRCRPPPGADRGGRGPCRRRARWVAWL
jgi:hypothetical protein